MELNIDGLKGVLHPLKDFIMFTSPKKPAEEDTFLKVQRYNKLKEANVFFGDSIRDLQRWENN